ncbi:neurensin 1-like isoform X2 [Takifugu flavidus]|uniref:Neurensin-2 n=1 Tax=Takifugu flavidus TaxID=433684 RepID=A0A5C6NFP5_9TELE|nr:neurensin 1-like isoform X2 [Takifugu flavidus]TWW65411.1 Neurensin-2 [Takifugu flavidus]
MALCSEACVSGSGGESSGSEAGSSCLHFGVRSYLHHFYEECSSSGWDRDAEDQGFVQSRRCQTSAVWKVSLVLGVLVLTAGITTLSVSYSTAFKIESFGEGDLFFVDNQAVSFNRGVHSSGAAGIGLSCLGSGLTAVGVLVWVLQLPKVKERLFRRAGGAEECGGSGSAPRVAGKVVTKSPGVDKGTTPVTVSKVQTEQPGP